MDSPWAILLCKFNDDESEPYDRERYEELFTTAGSGMLNMVDFFREMSHGTLDLSRSQVFGWYTLEKSRNEYSGSGINPQGRTDLITWAREAATKAGVVLDDYFSVVVCMNVSTDLFGGPYGVVCDDGRMTNGMSALSPSILGQEMGHAYGLNHSRTSGSLDDYNDPWDVMSTAVWPTMGAHPHFTDLDERANSIFLLGPGINAANMESQGWLDLSRVWTAGDQHHGTTIELRPLHRHDLRGYLAARIGQYLVEFRMPERWDAGIGTPMVLVHTFFDGYSYIHPFKDDSRAMGVGDIFEDGDAGDPLGAMIRIEVAKIDTSNRIATLRITRKLDRHPKAGPGITFGGVDRGGGGFVIVGGKIIWIEPRSPLIQMLENLAQLGESESISHAIVRNAVKQDALENIQRWTTSQLQQPNTYRSPAPPMRER
jgi:hypothetical protein